MIIVRLMGGLGNQMFQYAAGKRLAIARGVEMKLDTGFYGRSDSRSYALDAFPIHKEVASRAEIRYLRYSGKPWWRLQTNKARRAAKKLSPSHVQEQHFHFDERILNLGDDAYLDGYWQSEKYFTDTSDEIRKLFTIRDVSEQAQKMADMINSCHSVSLHVRRGDYTADIKTSSVHESLSVDYYKRAVDHIGGLVDPIEVFVFSDDIEWAGDNIILPCPINIVDAREGWSPAEDMWLISQCDHNIIANSSFSWWGAWLNSNDVKTVIAPVRWFCSKGYNTGDLIPNGWVRL